MALDLSKLNPNQRTAVTTRDGVMLVESCAGSGKTTTITYRIAALIEGGADPTQVLALTFTRKAANEMRERIQGLVGEKAKGLTIGTFHSVCARLLRESIRPGDAVETGFTIYDDTKTKGIAKVIVMDAGIEPSYFLSEVSRWKRNSLWRTMQEHFRDAKGRVVWQMISLVEQYESCLRKENALDFDDIILEFIKLMHARPEVAAGYRQRFRHILVDEFQDTDRVQMELVRLLSKDSSGNFSINSLCCVGDDDQTIYSWRGATIENLVEFERDYPDTLVIKMEDNYRSTGNIVKGAASLIQRNDYRREKTIRTASGDGEPIRIVVNKQPEHEAHYIAGKVQELRHALGISYKDFAVLYRTNVQSEPLERQFVESGIPYQIKGGMMFYDRKEVKDMLAYLEIFANPKADAAFLRICNVPARRMATSAIKQLKDVAAAQDTSLLGACANVIGPPNEFLRLLHALQANAGGSLSRLYDLLVERTGYLALCRRLDQMGDGESEYRVANLEQLGVRIERFADANPEAGPLEFLQDVSLMSRLDAEDEASTDKVTLTTVHGSKGLEWPVVFVVGSEEGLFPHRNSVTAAQVEEERRLFYVAMTRAKTQLFVTLCTERMSFANRRFEPAKVSRFVRELDAQYIKVFKTF